MELELKHLAPYLPYGLKSYQNYMGVDLIKEVDNLNIMNYVYGDTNAKIVLRPLSDLIKTIDHNGDKFIPMDAICKIRSVKYQSFSTDLKFKAYTAFKKDLLLQRLPFSFYNKIIEWHFDVFGLIDKGLAIDINTIQQPQPLGH